MFKSQAWRRVLIIPMSVRRGQVDFGDIIASQPMKDSVSKEEWQMAPEEQYPKGYLWPPHTHLYMCTHMYTWTHNFNTNKKTNPSRRVASLKQGSFDSLSNPESEAGGREIPREWRACFQ